MIRITLVFATAIALVACRSADVKDQETVSSKTWNHSMKNLQLSLAKLEPNLFSAQRFSDPSQREFIQAEIHQLSENSKNVAHDPTLIHRDPTVRFVASQFAGDLLRAEESFSEGRFEFSRYQLIKVVSTCVLCHTRTMHGPEFTYKSTEVFAHHLPVRDRAEYLVASRQFEAASKLLNSALRNLDGEKTPGWDQEYIAGLALVIAVQFEENLSNAFLVVQNIELNPKSSKFLQRKAMTWNASLKEWKKQKTSPQKLEDFRRLFEQRRSEIESMRVISGMLKLITPEVAHENLGEHLLLVGDAYEALGALYPYDLQDNYFESCVRMAPKSSVAKRCLTMLSNSVEAGYSGSSGIHVPIAVKIRLDQLRQIAE